MARKTEFGEWNAKANFVFKGTVIKLNTATVKHLSPTDRTVIVKVDEAIRASEVLEQYVGSAITVQLSKNERVTVGEKAMFYTQSLMVGETLVVQSFGHLPVTAAAATAAREEADPALREQVANADIVVTGKVTSVRTIEPASGRASGSRAKPFPPISEHEPVWREAVIKVAGVESGGRAPEEIVVRFAASTDVLWSQTPKFQPGQQGVFLLNLAQAVKPAAGKRARYTALSSASFQPMQKVEAIRSMIRSQKS